MFSFILAESIADLLQHGHLSDSPALEGGPGLTLDLYELIILSLWSLDVGYLHTERRVGIFTTLPTILFIDVTLYSRQRNGSERSPPRYPNAA